MNKKMIFVLLFSFIYAPLFAAKDLDLDALKDRIKKEYSKDIGSSEKDISSKIKDISTESPKSRFVDNSQKSESVEDKRHILVHMKLANRHFSKKNYDKAKEEVNTVFQRDSSHSGGHFMLAVIAGRQKDYKSAWYHINCAKEKDNSNKKIDDFISKLKTVSTEPKNTEWIPGVYNGIEQDASDRTFDLLEKLLSDECSSNIINISVNDYKDWEDGSNKGSLVKINIKASESINDKVGTLVETSLNKSKMFPSGMFSSTKADNQMILELGYNDIKPIKSDAKQIKEINDYINGLIEDFPDIAISNVEESEPKSGNQEIVYSISVRDFSSLNKFLRQISPFTLSYVLENMDLAYIPGSQDTIWKAKIKVTYKI